MRKSHTKRKEFSISKMERLSDGFVIQTVFKKGSRASVEGATLFVLSNNVGENRFLCTFKHGFGNAVERNRVRRVSKEIYRFNKNSLKKSFDFVLLVSKYSYSFDVWQNRICTLLQLLKVMND